MPPRLSTSFGLPSGHRSRLRSRSRRRGGSKEKRRPGEGGGEGGGGGVFFSAEKEKEEDEEEAPEDPGAGPLLQFFDKVVFSLLSSVLTISTAMVTSTFVCTVPALVSRHKGTSC